MAQAKALVAGRVGKEVMMSDRTPTKVMVTVLDLTPIEPQAFKVMNKGQFPDAISASVGHKPHGIVETTRGVYALCEEGVGNANPITEGNKYEVDFYAKTKDGGYCLPAVIASLNVDELKQLATPQRVNLADFIRTSGARLESNYTQWRKVLEPMSS